MWKRSGAWFFRGIPKFIKPTPQETTQGKRHRPPPRRALSINPKSRK